MRRRGRRAWGDVRAEIRARMRKERTMGLMDWLRGRPGAVSPLPWMPAADRKLPLEAVRLPRDERPHRRAVEWWHFMGYVGPTKPGAPVTDHDRTTFIVSVLKGQMQGMSHLAGIVILYDHARKTYSVSAKLGAMGSSYYELNDGRAFRFHFGPTGPARQGPPDAWSVDGGMGYYTIAIDTVQQLALELTQSEPAVFLNSGSERPGVVGYGSHPSGYPIEMAYYLWPMLKVRGTQGVGATERPVEGRAWMEHQWGDVNVGSARWTYIAVVIERKRTGEPGAEPDPPPDCWLFFRSGNRLQMSPDDWRGFRLQDDGSAEELDVHHEPVDVTKYGPYELVTKLLAKYKGKKDENTRYILKITPKHLHQECRTGLPTALVPVFWEGACDVTLIGSDGKEERGWAIMELAGYR